MSKNRASVFFSSSGGFSPKRLPLSNFTPPYCEEEWTVDSVQAPHSTLKHFYPTEQDISDIKAKFVEFNKKASPYAR